MIIIHAPYPNIQGVTILPNPEFGDTREPTSTVTVKKAVDGTLYTHIKRSTYVIFVWNFLLTRPKSLELRDFYANFLGKKCLVIDHENKSIIGYIMTNPIEFSIDRAGEMVPVTIEFKGIIQ